MEEVSTVISPGSRQAAWPIKTVSHVIYNVYMVRVVVLPAPGNSPLEIGDPIEAINLGESFGSYGALDDGTYAVMFRNQDKNYFYAAT
jgi:hypothetical protein